MPHTLRAEQVERLRGLLDQDQYWVRRGEWVRWLETGEHELRYPLEHMLRDGRLAAAAWVLQQKHVLHRAVGDGPIAPTGWARELPLTRGLLAR